MDPLDEAAADEIRGWLVNILPHHGPALNGPQDFHTVFKTGTILCDLANYCVPNCISGERIHRGAVESRQRDNLNLFIEAAALDLEVGDFVFEGPDLYDGRDFSRVIECILEIQQRNMMCSYPGAGSVKFQLIPEKTSDGKKLPPTPPPKKSTAVANSMQRGAPPPAATGNGGGNSMPRGGAPPPPGMQRGGAPPPPGSGDGGGMQRGGAPPPPGMHGGGAPPLPGAGPGDGGGMQRGGAPPPPGMQRGGAPPPPGGAGGMQRGGAPPPPGQQRQPEPEPEEPEPEPEEEGPSMMDLLRAQLAQLDEEEDEIRRKINEEEEEDIKRSMAVSQGGHFTQLLSEVGKEEIAENLKNIQPRSQPTRRGNRASEIIPLNDPNQEPLYAPSPRSAGAPSPRSAASAPAVSPRNLAPERPKPSLNPFAKKHSATSDNPPKTPAVPNKPSPVPQIITQDEWNHQTHSQDRSHSPLPSPTTRSPTLHRQTTQSEDQKSPREPPTGFKPQGREPLRESSSPKLKEPRAALTASARNTTSSGNAPLERQKSTKRLASEKTITSEIQKTSDIQLFRIVFRHGTTDIMKMLPYKEGEKIGDLVQKACLSNNYSPSDYNVVCEGKTVDVNALPSDLGIDHVSLHHKNPEKFGSIKVDVSADQTSSGSPGTSAKNTPRSSRFGGFMKGFGGAKK